MLSRFLFCALAVGTLVPAVLAVVESKTHCHARGGKLIFVKLQFGVTALGHEIFEGLQVEAEDDVEAEQDFNILCVPRNCAGALELASEPCSTVKGWLTRSLLEAHSGAVKDDMGVDHVFAGTIRQNLWLIEGVKPGDPVLPSPVIHVPPPPLTSSTHGSSARVVIICLHAPLANVFSDHVDRSAALAGIDVLDFVYFAACYLCERTPGCLERKVPSRADALCEMFHAPDDVGFEQLMEVAQDVVSKEARPDMLICYEMFMCHFFVNLLPRVPRMQFLGMNPLHGAPPNLAGVMLLDLARRAEQRELIFCTSGVTHALLEYHVGQVAANVASMTLFRAQLLEWALAAPWHVNKKVLVASSFLMQLSTVYLAMRTVMRQMPHNEFSEHRHDQFWTLSEPEHVEHMLTYSSAVYIPEHPYKNYFNDLYAMLLPLFLPTLDFLARIWLQLTSLDDDEVYDGWFDRTIPRVRIGGRADEDSLPPFDLRTDGLQKVRKWAASADYFHFPGIMTFNGMADLQRTSACPQSFRTGNTYQQAS